MEMKIGYSANPILSRRSILMVAVLVGVVTGGNLWLYRSDQPLGYGTYDNFGFSFEYPLLLDVSDAGFPDPGMGASDFAGVAQAQGVWEDVFQNFIVIWATEASIPELEDRLEQFYLLLADVGCVIDGKEPIVASEKGGHEMLYQTITFTQLELEFIGTVGVWHEPWPSLRANRVYALAYITFPEVATQHQVEETFQLYLESFSSVGAA